MAQGIEISLRLSSLSFCRKEIVVRFFHALTQVIFMLILSVFSASLAGAGELSPKLKAMLDETPADSPISVLVHFNDEVDIPSLSADLSVRKASRRQRHAEIVSTLQEAARVQDILASELDSAAAGEGLYGYTRYWISNVMVVFAVPWQIERIALRQEVDYVEPNFVPELIEPVEIRPTAAASEMDSRGIGVTPGLLAVRAPEVWRLLHIDGTGSLVGSLDTGVDGNHPALANRWRGNFASADECWLDVLGSGSVFPTDDHGHGTHTTGTMTGLAADDTIGVAPSAHWIAANAIDQGVSSDFDNDIIECFQWFTDPDGNPDTIDDVPDVVQNSWGVSEDFSGYTSCDDRWWDVIDNCEAAGVAVVFSAGNRGPDARTMGSPADRASTVYNCFSVGSTLHFSPYEISDFSSRGPTTCRNVDPLAATKPEVSAPGSDIYSAQPGGGYQYMSGTSMAGPHVAGVIALIRQADPDIEVDAIKQILMETAVDLGGAGEDNDYGWGIIDAFAAVEACMDGFGVLSGQLTNASYGGLPLAGAFVEIVERGIHLTTDSNGNFITSIPAGQYQLVASMPGFESQQIFGITIIEQQETIQDFSLTDIAGPILSDRTGELVSSDTMGPYPIGIEAFDASGVEEVVLNWRSTGQTWNTVPMIPSRGQYTGEIPGHSANTEINYFFTATDGLGYSSSLPDGAPMESFSLLVSEIIYITDAENPSDPPWQLGVATDQATSGLWVREDPVGTMYNSLVVQPEDDHTADPGVTCFVTGNGNPGDDADTQDVDDGCTTLKTPVFDLTGIDRAIVKYWYWYCEAGYSLDDDFVVEVSNNNGGSWVELNRTVDKANSWNQVSVELNTLESGAFELTDEVVFRFLACDLNESGLVEAAIDDFSIETFTGSELSPVEELPGVAASVVLRQNRPNPFNPATTIAFVLPQAEHTELTVYTIDGRRVLTLVNEVMPAGQQQVTWDGRDEKGRPVASGAYFYRLSVGEDLQVKRMVLVK
jgi:subtilisin family serine protease